MYAKIEWALKSDVVDLVDKLVILGWDRDLAIATIERLCSPDGIYELDEDAGGHHG